MTLTEQTRAAIIASHAAPDDSRAMQRLRYLVAAALTVDSIRAQFGDVIADAVAESFADHFERADTLAEATS